MTDLRKANESVAWLKREFGIDAVVEPITITYRDLSATIGYEVVLIFPMKEEVARARIRVASQDDLGSEPSE